MRFLAWSTLVVGYTVSIYDLSTTMGYMRAFMYRHFVDITNLPSLSKSTAIGWLSSAFFESRVQEHEIQHISAELFCVGKQCLTSCSFHILSFRACYNTNYCSQCKHCFQETIQLAGSTQDENHVAPAASSNTIPTENPSETRTLSKSSLWRHSQAGT